MKESLAECSFKTTNRFFFKKCVLWFRLNLQWRDATSLHWLRDTGCCTWEKSSKILFQVWKDSPSLLYFEKPLSKSRSIDAEDQEAELCKIAHIAALWHPLSLLLQHDTKQWKMTYRHQALDDWHVEKTHGQNNLSRKNQAIIKKTTKLLKRFC